MVKMSDESVDYISNIKRIGKGSIISIGITIVLLFVFSLLLTYTSLSESTIPIVTLIITGVSILIGSQFSTMEIRKNGILNGAAIGGIYILLLYTISSMVSGNFGVSLFSILMIIISIVTGAFRRNNRS